MKDFTKKSLDDLARTMNVIPEDERNGYWGIYDYGRKKSCFKSLLVIMFMLFMIHNSIPANNFQKDASEDTLNSSVGKWHPKMFYIVLPDLSLKYILPYEPDQSGFYNMFFISKESGETLLLDTIEDSIRYFTPFLSGNCYDVVLLYNNGKYVKQNNIFFKNGAVVDMSNQRFLPSDSISERWKATRAFDDTVNDQVSDGDDMDVSDFIIKGYILSEVRLWQLEQYWKHYEPVAKLQSSGSIVKSKKCTDDGYFEIDAEDDTEQTLRVSPLLHQPLMIDIIAPCGLFLVMKGFGKARRL